MLTNNTMYQEALSCSSKTHYLVFNIVKHNNFSYFRKGSTKIILSSHNEVLSNLTNWFKQKLV